MPYRPYHPPRWPHRLAFSVLVTVILVGVIMICWMVRSALSIGP